MADSISSDVEKSPRHVAIIMDGNGRWAAARGRPRTYGHSKGIEAVKRTVKAAADLGIEYLTLFGFSSENWSRPAAEVRELMHLLRIFLRSEVAELHRNGVCLRVIGDRTRLDGDIVDMIEHAEALCAQNSALNLTVALSYGSRQEIASACRRITLDVAAGRLHESQINESTLSRYMFTADIPDPDLIIRTSGEKRLSNFMLWQAAYTEFAFLDTLWPDFSREHLEAAIGDFRRRERRYGALAGGE